MKGSTNRSIELSDNNGRRISIVLKLVDKAPSELEARIDDRRIHNVANLPAAQLAGKNAERFT